MPKPSPIKQLYEKLMQSSEIPIIESSDIISKGLYRTEYGTKEIYIKQSLNHREKLKVLLHEYSHHIHLTHHYNKERRTECEIIANGSAFFVCGEFGLKLFKEVDLSKFSDDADVVRRVGTAIETVANHILNGLKQNWQHKKPRYLEFSAEFRQSSKNLLFGYKNPSKNQSIINKRIRRFLEWDEWDYNTIIDDDSTLENKSASFWGQGRWEYC